MAPEQKNEINSFRSNSSSCNKKRHTSCSGLFAGHIPGSYLHLETNGLKGNDAPEEIADQILNLAASVKVNQNQVFISGLVVRNKKLNKKCKELNRLLKGKCGTREMLLIDIKNINLNMLNKNGLC